MELKRHIGDAEKHWVIRDTLTKADGTVEHYTFTNSIVNGLGKFLGSLVGSAVGVTSELYIAVGGGSPAWDGAIPEPSLTDIKLTNEIARKKVTSIVFLDELGAVSPTPTRNVQCTVEFGATEAIGDLREYAMFGSATATKDSGIMLNKKNHKKIPKENGDTLERIIVLKL